MGAQGSSPRQRRPISLRLRLLLLAAIAMSLVLGLAGAGFSWLYRQHVEKFVLTDLSIHMNQLLSGIVMDADGKVRVVATLSDPRFEEPGGGLYWQVDVTGQGSERSRSLWDETITVPTPPATAEEDHTHILSLSSGDEVFASEKMVIVTGKNGAEKQAVVTVGLDRMRVITPVSEFRRVLLAGLAVMYAALLLATFLIVQWGLRPLQAVRRGIEALRLGAMHVDESELPAEVLPLASEVNALVAARAEQLTRARQRAANLAHGLKTPLAVMQSIANELRLRGETEAAGNISLNTSQMRDLVDRELTRSRMADGTTTHRADLELAINRVIATMKKAPRGDALLWSTATPAKLEVAMDKVDLVELLGNLLDNARKHATSMVRVSHDGHALVVEDDGGGVDDALLASIFERGRRLDEKMPGSGIGLAIVADLADAYGLTLAAQRSDLGGLALQVGLKGLQPLIMPRP